MNLEYLARVVFSNDGTLYPDSVVGTDSHTTMINGLGVLGWGVGGIEAEAVMLGQPISMVLPEVVGYKLTGEISQYTTSTDVVLTITKVMVAPFCCYFGPNECLFCVESAQYWSCWKVCRVLWPRGSPAVHSRPSHHCQHVSRVWGHCRVFPCG